MPLLPALRFASPGAVSRCAVWGEAGTKRWEVLDSKTRERVWVEPLASGAKPRAAAEPPGLGGRASGGGGLGEVRNLPGGEVDN